MSSIGLYLKNIYKEKELDKNLTTEDFSIVAQESFELSFKFDKSVLDMLGRLS